MLSFIRNTENYAILNCLIEFEEKPCLGFSIVLNKSKKPFTFWTCTGMSCSTSDINVVMKYETHSY